MSVIGSLRTMFAEQEAPPMGDQAWSESTLFNFRFGKYNPDDLIGRKGFNVYKRMMLDEQVKAVVRFKRDAITSRDWFFEAPEELPEEQAQERVALSEAVIRNMEGSLLDALNGIMSGVYNGFSMTEIVYGELVSDGRTWWGIKRLKLRPFDTFRFKADSHGNVEEVIQSFENSEQKIDVSRFIHYVQNPEEDEHYGQSELRACYRAYWSKDVLIKLYNIHMERHASGFVYATPKDGVTVVPGSPLETSLRNVLSNIQAKTAMLLPNGIELTVVSPSNKAGYVEAIAMHDKSIAKALLVPNLLGISEQGQTGSYSQSQTQFEAFLMTLDSDAARLEEALNEQLFRRLAQYNWGDDLYPRFKFKPVNEARKQQLLTTWKDLVTAGAVKPGEADEKHLRELMDFPAPEDGTSAPPPQVTPPIGGADTGAEVPVHAIKAAEKRVDFGVLLKRSEAIEAQYATQMAEVTQDIAEYLARKATTDPEKTANLEVPIGMRERLRRVTARMLRESWQMGRRHAKAESRQAKFVGGEPDPLGKAAGEFFKSKSFMISGAVSDRILAKAQQAIFQGIKQGATQDDIREEVKAILEAEGIYKSTSQLETIVRTNSFEAINEARFDYFRDSRLGNFVEALEYSAILDDRTTAICTHLDGRVYEKDDPLWATYRPPNHFNCRSLLIAVTAADRWERSENPTLKPQSGFD